jgi:hypothetical protein
LGLFFVIVEKIELCHSDVEMDSDELDMDMSCSEGSGSDSEEHKEVGFSLLQFLIFYFAILMFFSRA